MPGMGGCLGWVSMLPHCFNGIAVTGRERLADVFGTWVLLKNSPFELVPHRRSILRRSCLTFDKRKVQGRIWRTTTRLVVRAKKFREAFEARSVFGHLGSVGASGEAGLSHQRRDRKWMEPCCVTV